MAWKRYDNDDLHKRFRGRLGDLYALTLEYVVEGRPDEHAAAAFDLAEAMADLFLRADGGEGARGP